MLFLLACTDAEPADTAPTAHDTAADTALALDDTAPPVDTAGPADEAAGVDGVSARIHEDFGSLVYVSWTQDHDASAHISYSFDSGEWHTTPVRNVTGGEVVEQVLLGVPYGEVVSYAVVTDDGSGEQVSALRTKETDALPLEVLQPTLHVADEANWYDGGSYLLTSLNEDTGGWTQGTYWAFIIDRKGRVVWARETADHAWTIYARISLDGDDILLDEATYWSDFARDGEDGRVVRMKLDGTVEATYAFPGLHHAWVELGDGLYAYGRATSDNNEYLSVLDPAKELTTDLWECGAAWSSSYCQSNSLWYSETRDSFLYSFYTHDTLVEIDRNTGEELHSWGRQSDWTFDPTTSQFDWQHGATYTDEGTLLLSTHIDEGSKDCAVREYTVNEAASSLDQIWSFAVEDGIACNTAGEAHRLPNGNTLHNYGSGGRTREALPDGSVVWDVEWDGERLQGRGIWLDDLYTFMP